MTRFSYFFIFKVIFLRQMMCVQVQNDYMEMEITDGKMPGKNKFYYLTYYVTLSCLS